MSDSYRFSLLLRLAWYLQSLNDGTRILAHIAVLVNVVLKEEVNSLFRIDCAVGSSHPLLLVAGACGLSGISKTATYFSWVYLGAVV